MSNFTGVTFAQQKVLPSDDAIIRRSILSDGILYGCELSYSGSTLTMGAGQLLICGRQIRHPSAQNWAVADATSGFARLVLTVDLTRTASKDVFDQVVDSIEYATAQDGFPDLNQSDVNTTGSVYQIAACVVSLGTGGITGIVEQLGPCEVIGGGGGLNFSVVGGLTQPADPTENTIWVETDFEITGYAFSATQPADPMEGMVWITVGASSPVEFNALKKNGIQVYPLSAKQFIDGAWVAKEAKSYQNGEWDMWFSWLFKDGVMTNEHGALGNSNKYLWTGGTGGVNTCSHSATVKNGVLILSYSRTGSSHSFDSGYFYFADKIDFTNISLVTITCGNLTNTFYQGAEASAIGVISNLAHSPSKIATATLKANGTVTLDTSEISGQAYLAISMTAGTTSAGHTQEIIEWGYA